MNNVIVRPCRYDEVEKILKLNKEIKEDLVSRGKGAFFEGVSEDIVYSCVNEPSFIIGVFAQDSEELLGYCICQQLSNYPITSAHYMSAFDLPMRVKPFMWSLTAIAVKPHISNHKIGSLLLVSVICYLSNRGTEQYLVGMLHPENEKAIRILKKYNPYYSPVFEIRTSKGMVPRRRFCIRV